MSFSIYYCTRRIQSSANLQSLSPFKVKAVNKLKSLRSRNAERRKAIASICEHPTSTELVDEGCTDDAHPTVVTRAHLATETEKPVTVVAPQPKRMDSAIALEDTKGCAEDSDKEGERLVRGKRNEDEDRDDPSLPNKSVPFLNIGVDGADGEKQAEYVVTESPTRTPEHIYEEAYGEAIGPKETTCDPIQNLVSE